MEYQISEVVVDEIKVRQSAIIVVSMGILHTNVESQNETKRKDRKQIWH